MSELDPSGTWTLLTLFFLIYRLEHGGTKLILLLGLRELGYVDTIVFTEDEDILGQAVSDLHDAHVSGI